MPALPQRYDLACNCGDRRATFYISSSAFRFAAFTVRRAWSTPLWAIRSACCIAAWLLSLACDRKLSISSVARLAISDALRIPSFVVFLMDLLSSRMPSLARSICLRPSLVPSNNQAAVPAARPTNAYVTILFFVFIFISFLLQFFFCFYLYEQHFFLFVFFLQVKV